MDSVIEITGCDHRSKIAAIKAVIVITGLGLKDAKGVIDAVVNTGEPQSVILLGEFTKERLARIMKDSRVTYCHIPNTILEKLKDVLSDLLDEDRQDVGDHVIRAIKLYTD